MLGNALVARLYYSLIAKKTSFLFETKLDELILKNNRVVGAQVINGAEKIQLFARKGVIIATGGFGHNKQLRESFMTPTVPLSMAVPENMGEGIVAAQKIGALVRPNIHGTGAQVGMLDQVLHGIDRAVGRLSLRQSSCRLGVVQFPENCLNVGF